MANRKPAKKIPSTLSDMRKMRLLEEYMGGAKVSELAETYNMNPKTLEHFIDRICKKLHIVRETNAIMCAQKMEQVLPKTGDHKVRVSYNDPKLINEKFLEMLSGPEDAKLSEAEQTYSVMFAQTGNNKKAILAAGLDAGLKTSSNVQGTVSHALMLRGHYLRNKPLVAAAITSIQEYNLKALNVDKDYVQINLVQNIEELKEECSDSPKARGYLLRAIELLGKTIGSFQENINISQVDPADALDELVNMAKNHTTGTYESEQSTDADSSTP